jgi:MFS transporter, FHS family, L-fucose permease
MKFKTFPIFLAFLCMGFGDAVGPFVGLAKESFNLSYTMAQLIPFVGFIMFGLLSIPVGILQDKTGKKFILLLGLIIAFLGLIIPSLFGFSTYLIFLVTVMLLGAGSTILQVAGNPIMRDVSEKGKYSRNLSLAQFVKAIGSLSGPLLPAAAAYFWKGDWSIVFPVYSVCLLITLTLIAFLKVEKHQEKKQTATFASCFALLKNGYVFMMVMAIFVYVGAEVCMSSSIPLFLKSAYNIDISTVGVLGTGLFFLALTIGRFMGGIVLTWISPKKFFIVTSVLSLLGIVGLFLGVKVIAIISMFVIGLGFANIFPLVFSIAVDAMPERTNELSGLMVTAIAGGALIPPIMGFVSDKSTVLMGFLVPLAAILYITFIALKSAKKA